MDHLLPHLHPEMLTPTEPALAEYHELEHQVIDGAANSPVKLITLTTMAMEPGHEFTASDLGKTTNAYQGSTPSWDLHGSTYAKYCHDSLEPAGLVAASQVPSQRGKDKLVDAYTVTEAGVDVGLPIAGAVLLWELRHEGISAQQVLGSTNSPEDVVQRAPSVRLAVLRAITESTEGSLARVEIERAVGLPIARAKGITDWLVNQGIVVEENRYDPEDRTFCLTEPDYARLQRHASPRVETRATYDAAAAFIGDGRTEVTGKEFLDKAKALYPDLDRTLMWKRLVASIASGRSHFIDAAPFDDNPQIHTRLSLAVEHAEAVTELLETFSRLEADAAYRTEMRGMAYRITDTPELVSLLMEKARRFSPVANALEPEEWATVVSPILAEHGANGVSIDALYDAIRAAGHRVSRRGFGEIVRSLSLGDEAVVAVNTEKGASKIRSPLGRVSLRSLMES